MVVLWLRHSRGQLLYSAITGGAQRLANGNTLATLGTKGQLMEVTSSGDVVWDYHVGSTWQTPKYPEPALEPVVQVRATRAEVDPLLRQ